jgi:glycosyltransferase involved in cell wall biosynthesis
MRVSIVTPVLNGARFLDETILSVVTQAGDFTIRYHVQDGGSTDETIAKLKRWEERLCGDFPILCRAVEFSYASAQDRGMYNAINLAFEGNNAADVMTWLNADDRLEPGAIASATQIMTRMHDIDWLCDRVSLMDETGARIHSFPVTPFPRKAIAAGIFDGRFAPPIIQQEGMFWRPALWHAVGGLNAAFCLAGDFDLWRRFARFADLVIVDAVFGCWRRRAGQLSSNIAAYRAEIDRFMTDAEKRLRTETAEEYRLATEQQCLRRNGYSWRTVSRPEMGDWACGSFPQIGTEPVQPVVARAVDEEALIKRYENVMRQQATSLQAQNALLQKHAPTIKEIKTSFAWHVTKPIRLISKAMKRSARDVP